MAEVRPPKRDSKGRFAKITLGRKNIKHCNIQIDHNYAVGHVCEGPDCQNELCELQPGNSTNVSADGWKSRRRVIELEAQEIEIPPEMHQIDYPIVYM